MGIKRPYTRKKVKKVSPRVRILKSLFAFVAIMLAMSILVYPLIESKGERLQLTYENVEVTGNKDEQSKIINPKLYGMDNKNQPFTITADYGVQKDKDHVKLSNVFGDITMHDSTWVAASANQADISIDKEEMVLNGNVLICTNAGYELQTDSAVVNYKSNSARGDFPVVIEGEGGSIKAKNFKIPSGGNQVIFGGRVHTTLYPNRS